MMLTEAEAWRMIGEAFEARAAHPELGDYLGYTDIAWDGLCRGIDRIYGRGGIDYDQHVAMSVKAKEFVEPEAGYLYPEADQLGGPELRATLAYLFAEEAAA